MRIGSLGKRPNIIINIIKPRRRDIYDICLIFFTRTILRRRIQKHRICLRKINNFFFNIFQLILSQIFIRILKNRLSQIFIFFFFNFPFVYFILFFIFINFSNRFFSFRKIIFFFTPYIAYAVIFEFSS